MNKKYILALDQGTSSSRAILFNHSKKIVDSEQSEFPQYYPHAGFVEHNPEEIWESQYKTAKNLLEKNKIHPDEIAAIGITNQRETTVVWDKNTGIPIHNAIVWQDQRTKDFCDELIAAGLSDLIKTATGLPVDTYFSAGKLHWILENVPGAQEKAKAGDLLFGTIDTWLMWKLTAGALHITDFSNASRTMLFNINTLEWDSQILNWLEIPESMLPEVRFSSEIYGNTAKELFGGEIPIASIAGDQQAALFGQRCFTPGSAKNTYGTGCFMLMNTGTETIKSESGLLTTIAWGIDGKINYALEGSVFIAGAAIKWLRDGLKIVSSAKDTQAIAQEVESTEGVYFVPAFSGLGTPYWDMTAKGTITGLTQGITDKHIVRATLEALAYQTRDVLDAMTKDSGITLKELNVDGGAAINDFLMQFQADILDTKVIRPQIIETTALGAALMAGRAVGFWTDAEITDIRAIDKTFYPDMPDAKREKLYAGWQDALKRSTNYPETE